MPGNEEIEIRVANERDAADAVRLAAAANPTLVQTPAAWLHRRRTTPERAHELVLVAESGGDVVGYAHAGLNYQAAGSTTAYVYLTVEADRRGRGIGGTLYDALVEHARAIDATALQAMLFESEAGLRFATARAFAQARTAFEAALDPRTLELQPRPDVVLAPFTDLDRRDIHGVDEAGTRDEPTTEQVEEFPYDEWLDTTWKHPDFSPAGSFAALVDGKPVSLSMLYVAPELRRASNGFTTTLREHRGRGLALACKIASLRWAAATGIERVLTANDDTNAPMLAINRRLGYEPLGRLVTMRRELEPAPEPASADTVANR